MAEYNNIKKEKIRYLIEHYHEPLIFKNMLKWNILYWSLRDWEVKLKNKTLVFRKSDFLPSKMPVWESKCTTIEMTMKEFIEFQSKEDLDSWVYFDYKYMHEWFENNSELLQNVSWENFGYPEKTASESTIWIGSKGAHTPCHVDTYGCNLIAQIYGCKKWIVFPPEENLQPTRVPYEESSIYSKLNFFTNNINAFRGISHTRSVILHPGDVLFLPPGWWHYVENLETAISINIWLPLPQDEKRHIEEALTQMLVSQLTKNFNSSAQKHLLNSNSVDISSMPFTRTLSQLKTVLKIYKDSRINRCNNQIDDMNKFELKGIIEEFSEKIKIIPRLSRKEFMSNLQNNETVLSRGATSSKQDIINTNDQDDDVILLEKIINSFCHPEILSAVADKLIKEMCN